MAEAPLKHGATAPRHSWRDRLRVWADSHRHFARQSFHRLLEKPLATTVTLSMLAIAIALPTLLHVAVQNVAQWTRYSDGGLEITAYLRTPTIAPANAEAWQAYALPLLARTHELAGATTVEFISPAAALQKLEAIAGQESVDIIASLPANPLPAAIRVVVGTDAELANTARAIAAQLGRFAEVESVSFNLDWFRKAQAMVELVTRINLAASMLLGLGVVLVIGNTVRVSIESRRDEILVAKLVGATNAYARRPFLYLGVWLGVAGALLALVFAWLAVLALTFYIRPLEEAYNAQIDLQGLSLPDALLIFATSAALGWLGAWAMCGNQLGKLQPE